MEKVISYLKKQTTLLYLVYFFHQGDRHIDAKVGTIGREIKLKFKDWDEAFKTTVLVINRLKDYEKRQIKKIEKECKGIK
jgi:hypothetical protein